jgi:tetratricopeptide (TPR) repeat protein
MKAEALNRMRRAQEALREYHLAIDAAPDFIEARFSLGDLYYKLGRLDEAEGQFRQILKTEPNHSHAIAYLKVVEEKKRKREERRQPRPQRVRALYEAALRDYETGDGEKAQQKLMEALGIAHELKKDDALKLLVSHIRLLLGRVRCDAAEYDTARTHLQAGLDILAGVEKKAADFPLGEGGYWLAVALLKLNREEEAALHFRKAIPFLRRAAESAPSGIEKAELLVHSARANDALEQPKEEVRDYSGAAEAFPQYPLVHFMAARAALKAGDAAKAFEFFRKSIERKAKVAESYFEIGRLLLEHKKPMDAIVNFENALENKPDAYHIAACNYYLGYAFYELEMYAEAATAWREYLKHAKDPEMKKLIELKLLRDPKLKSE